ncbi:MAG: multicopper oxidase domain-containing protein [Acidobacteriota bacterium]
MQWTACPSLRSPPIAPSQTFIYEFDLLQSGTLWYHSHTMLKEQRGLFGSLIIRKLWRKVREK